MGASGQNRNSDSFGIMKSGSRRGKEKDNDVKKTARVALITVIAVAVLFAAALLINSDYFRQNWAAVTIDNEKYSITDFNYYYENAYMQYYNAFASYGQYASSMLPDRTKSLKSQIYDETTGETWSAFFEKMAFEHIKADNKVYMEAVKAGYQLLDDDKKQMETDIGKLQTSVQSNGYSTLSAYLKAVYGRGMTEAAYRKDLERTYLIQSYTKHVNDSFTYTDDQLKTFYGENKDNYDTYTYRSFLVSAADVNQSDYADETAYQLAKDAAVAAAGVAADRFASKITGEKSFLAAAKEYDPEQYKGSGASKEEKKGDQLDAAYSDWMKDASRKSGDASAFKAADGYYVVLYMNRSDNRYQTVNIRQILVKPETIDQSKYVNETDTTKYDADVANAKKAAEDTANKINQEWVAAGATEDKLAELTSTYASQISADDSKRSENVYKGQLPDEVNSWIYAASRKTGDNTLVYSESAAGYYIIYFEGKGKLYSDVLAETAQRDKDLQAWKSALTGGEPKATWLMTLTK